MGRRSRKNKYKALERAATVGALHNEQARTGSPRMNSRPAVRVLLLLLIPFSPPAWGDEPRSSATQLRVCADPNNLPFSDYHQQGFENKIAELLARERGQQVAYTWWPQRRGFLRSTLQAGACDVVMGVPAGYDPVLTTPPYYRSTYVFVSRKSDAPPISSFDDPRLRALKIGVHLIGDDYANSPPAHLLSSKGIVTNVVGYSIYGDYAEDSPPGKIIAAVASREIDVAIVWGPIAGYFAKHQTDPMNVIPVPSDVSSPTLPFSYSIAVGVRRGDEALKSHLTELLQRKAPEIQQILSDYGIPTQE